MSDEEYAASEVSLASSTSSVVVVESVPGVLAGQGGGGSGGGVGGSGGVQLPESDSPVLVEVPVEVEVEVEVELEEEEEVVDEEEVDEVVEGVADVEFVVGQTEADDGVEEIVESVPGALSAVVNPLLEAEPGAAILHPHTPHDEQPPDIHEHVQVPLQLEQHQDDEHQQPEYHEDAAYYDEHGAQLYDNYYAEPSAGAGAGVDEEAHVPAAPGGGETPALEDETDYAELGYYDEDGNFVYYAGYYAEDGTFVYYEEQTEEQQEQEQQQPYDDLETTRYNLQQAVENQDYNRIDELIAVAESYGMDRSDDTFASAKAMAKELHKGRQQEQIGTYKVYLKQGIDARSRKQLRTTLELCDELRVSNPRMNSEYFKLVSRARELLAELEQENAQTIAFYLRQGLQLRSREALKEAMSGVREVDPALLDPQLVTDAQAALERLDAEHMLLGFIDGAIRSNDEDVLDDCLRKASVLKMQRHPKAVEARELLTKLRKRRRRGSSRSGLGAIFRRKKQEHSAKHHLFFEGKVSLDRAIELSEHSVPTVLHTCVDFLREHAMEHPGLFRIPGNKASMEELKETFSYCESVKGDMNVDDCAGVLKQYLRSLPEPLVPFSRYADFLGALDLDGEDARLDRLAQLCAELPPNNLNTMSFLVYFLHEFSQNERVHKMGASNLAIVFAPNLLRPEVETQESVMVEMTKTIEVMTLMIAHPERCLPREAGP